MAEFRLLNEFGSESVILALEPARKCVAHCTYCFAELNRRKQAQGRSRNIEDPRSFERVFERAAGPDYDPTDFLQWALKNRLPVGWANTVEPFQDVAQARAILTLCDKMNTPLFVQTKGINIDAVWDKLLPFSGNASIFVSMGSDDDRVIRRFEPGTPLSEQRWALMERAARAGFHVTLALAPYHEDWVDDPVRMIQRAASIGVQEVFFDRLHLNSRQKETATDKALIGLTDNVNVRKVLNHVIAIYATTIDLGMDWVTCRRDIIRWGAVPTLPAICPDSAVSRGRPWPYAEGRIFQPLYTIHDDAPDDGPIVVKWEHALHLMETNDAVREPFRVSVLENLMVVQGLPAAWKRALGRETTMPDLHRAMWNTAKAGGFVWRSPHASVAVRPGGAKEPWLDEQGNIVMIFDPTRDTRKRLDFREVEDLDELRTLTIKEHSDA